MKFYLVLDKYVLGPFLKAIVSVFHCLFICLDRITGAKIEVLSDEEELQDYRKRSTLSIMYLAEAVEEMELGIDR